MATIPVVVDACSSLNLFATGRPVELIRAANIHMFVLPDVQREAQHLFGAPHSDGVRGKEPIDWGSLQSSAVAQIQEFPEEALAELIEFATLLTDVDAKCVAIAKHLNLELLSDDGKVRKVFSNSGGVGLRSTTSVIRDASAALSLSRAEVCALFDLIRRRARFEPPKSDPGYSWYSELMSDHK